MKKVLLASVLATLTLATPTTYATDLNVNSNNSSSASVRTTTTLNNTTLQAQQALGGAGGFGGAGGNVSINNPAPDFGDLRIVPPAIAPSINTSIICPMVMQGSKAGSVFFFSGSGTHAPDIVPLCVAWHLNQKDVVEKLTCQASKEYAKANPNCK